VAYFDYKKPDNEHKFLCRMWPIAGVNYGQNACFGIEKVPDWREK